MSEVRILSPRPFWRRLAGDCAILYLVNDQPFFSFDDYGIDFDRLYLEATAFMIQYPNYSPSSQQNPFLGDPDNLVRFANVELTDTDRERMVDLDQRQTLDYYKIVKKALFVWNIYNLNPMSPWDGRQKCRADFFPKTLKVMPYFVELIRDLPIFESIGWARIYGNEAYNFVNMHVDYSPHINLDQFIYFNLNNKGLFLQDVATGEKVYPKNKAIFFDAKNTHGTDQEPYFTFSLRVDGCFTDEFRNSLRFSRLEDSVETNP